MNKIFLLIIFIFFTHSINSLPTRKEMVTILFKSIENWYGTHYVLGGNNKDGIDCSSFVSQVYKDVFNIDLPRRVSEQKLLGEIVKDELQPGDVLFFKITDQVSHVGIYIFNNKFVHAASSGHQTGVIKSSLNESYYKKRFVYAKRFIKLPSYMQKNNNEAKSKIIIGKYLYKDIVFNISDEFNEVEDIFLQLKTINNSKYSVNVVKNKILIKKINFDDIKSYKIKLKSGEYKIQLTDNSNNKIDEKNIVVK